MSADVCYVELQTCLQQHKQHMQAFLVVLLCSIGGGGGGRGLTLGNPRVKKPPTLKKKQTGQHTW